MKTLWSALVFVLCVAASDSASLWRDPGPVERLDLSRGPGGRVPAPPFRFVEKGQGGTSPKLIVQDKHGAKWMVKFGDEAKPETFASRIVQAAGYYADPDYLVRNGRIEGAPDSGSSAAFLKNGEFRDARFELVDEARYQGKTGWTLDDPALKDTRELSGLKILFILLGNWDIKPENMSVLNVNGRRIYAITDWGATMGRASDFSGRSKWDCVNYSRDSEHLVHGIENGFVVFNHDGKQAGKVTRGIRVEHVNWLMDRLRKLTDAQIRQALQSAGATQEEASCFAPAFRKRLDRLTAVRDMPADGETVTRTRREIRIIRKPAPAPK